MVDSMYKPDPNLVGEFIKGEYCPKCGCTLLGNKVGDKWCSRPGCSFGLEDYGL